MSPAERARQIDREEFAAESAAIRARALAYSKECREEEAQKFRSWLQANEEQPARNDCTPPSQRNGSKSGGRTVAANAKLYSAFGHRRTLTEWSNETGISVAALQRRISSGWPIDRALTAPVRNCLPNQQRRALL